MPVVAITLVSLLWLQAPESRIYSAYQAPPLLFQSFISHVWTGQGTTWGGESGKYRGQIPYCTWHRPLLFSTQTFIPPLWQVALVLVFNNLHTNYNLGKDITSQEKNFALYSFFKIELSLFWFNVSISSLEIQI